MNYIEQDITSIMGVWHIVPTHRSAEIGEWKILTDQSKCAYIHRQLSNHWAEIIAKIPPEVVNAAPQNFSTPMISSKRAREYQDDDSDADSYGSLLTAGTDMSAMTLDDASFNEPPSDYQQHQSYAAAAAASTSTSRTGDTPISSPTNSIYPDWQKEKQELEALIRTQALQIERIQADLQAKISRSEDLEEKLAKAIELAHTRDERHEEMLSKFEMLMQNQQAGYNAGGYLSLPGGYGTHDETTPTTPERFTPNSDPPPPKKPNTNASPNRTIYALFRQPQSRHASHRHGSGRTNLTAKQQNQSSKQQPMDTDESPNEPTLGADKGKKKE